MAHTDTFIFLNSITWVFFLFFALYFFFVLYFLPSFYKKVRIRFFLKESLKAGGFLTLIDFFSKITFFSGILLNISSSFHYLVFLFNSFNLNFSFYFSNSLTTNFGFFWGFKKFFFFSYLKNYLYIKYLNK